LFKDTELVQVTEFTIATNPLLTEQYGAKYITTCREVQLMWTNKSNIYNCDKTKKLTAIEHEYETTAVNKLQ